MKKFLAFTKGDKMQRKQLPFWTAGNFKHLRSSESFPIVWLYCVLPSITLILVPGYERMFLIVIVTDILQWKPNNKEWVNAMFISLNIQEIILHMGFSPLCSSHLKLPVFSFPNHKLVSFRRSFAFVFVTCICLPPN